MPQSASLASSDGLVAYQLGNTAIQVFNVHRRQMAHDVVRSRFVSLRAAVTTVTTSQRLLTPCKAITDRQAHFSNLVAR